MYTYLSIRGGSPYRRRLMHKTVYIWYARIHTTAHIWIYEGGSIKMASYAQFIWYTQDCIHFTCKQSCVYDVFFMEPPSYIQMCAVVCICAYQMYTVLCIWRLLYGDPPSYTQVCVHSWNVHSLVYMTSVYISHVFLHTLPFTCISTHNTHDRDRETPLAAAHSVYDVAFMETPLIYSKVYSLVCLCTLSFLRKRLTIAWVAVRVVSLEMKTDFMKIHIRTYIYIYIYTCTHMMYLHVHTYLQTCICTHTPCDGA